MNGIKCIRERCNISMSELADRIGVTRQTISLWERGKSLPDIKAVIKMTEIFGVTSDYILCLEK